MDGEDGRLRIFFFPYLAQGHIIPMVEMARLFAARGVRATIVTTPLNALSISKAIAEHKTDPDHGINIRTIKFSSAEAGLPEGCERVDAIPSPALTINFFKGTKMLQEPLEQLLLKENPNCLIADMFYPWANDSAAKFGIPRIVFHGTGFFSLCATECIKLYEPYKKVSSESESFVIPNLPGDIKMTSMLLADYIKSDGETEIKKLWREAKESEEGSYGVIVNSFRELEHVYVDHYCKVFGRKAWHVGPVSLLKRDNGEKAERGNEVAIDEHECLKWLDSKNPNSVVYVCFGSVADFTETQLKEIAIGLEASGHNFIWVVRRSKKETQDKEEWLPEGFEKRMEGRGLLIRGWAPQLLILDHESVGGFVTHCGWNSTLEAVCAGVPMVTWPLSADQFYNERLVTQVLQIGVAVGVKKWVRVVGDGINWEALEKAVNRIMVGEEAEEMRNRTKKLAHLARGALEEGGSSYSNLNALIQELGSRCH